ncbi:uncharacterized protein LOC131329997 isoform X3 [Rhododendron vialii]|uniref:uncharacterized protein LOC131329997 isoform X3 n=1 Tax=Rhododendron vialii TaxID=182163 RepID=UPI00265FC307|nr:uncharacterized protein LOC131329997 isoform X3 [Rhododendron vialii]
MESKSLCNPPNKCWNAHPQHSSLQIFCNIQKSDAIPSEHRTSLAKIDGQHMSMWYRMWRALSCQLHLVEVQLIVPLRTWNLSRSFTQKLRYIQQFLYYCFGAKDLSLNMFLENGKIVHLYAKLQIHSHKHPRVDFLYQLTFQWSVSDDKWICLRESDDQASRSH